MVGVYRATRNKNAKKIVDLFETRKPSLEVAPTSLAQRSLWQTTRKKQLELKMFYQCRPHASRRNHPQQRRNGLLVRHVICSERVPFRRCRGVTGVHSAFVPGDLDLWPWHSNLSEPARTHDLRRSRQWSIAVSITSCSKSSQICIKRFRRISWIFVLYRQCCMTPQLSKFKAHDFDEPKIRFMQFSLITSNCNITFSVFRLSQGSKATLIRWRGWNS